MSKADIKNKFDEIVAFAEVEKFLDTPVKRYSSGMYVRLAFAVSAHLEPEVLIVDEVLAVGDAQFQKKCMGKMQDVGSGGGTLLFVSHNMAAVSSLCNRAILLNKGKVAKVGETSEVVLDYYSNDNHSFSSIEFNDRKVGDDIVRLHSGRILNAVNNATHEVKINEPSKIEMSFEVLQDCYFPLVSNFHFYTNSGECAFIVHDTKKRILKKGKYFSLCEVPANFLNEGCYFVGLAISSFEHGIHVHFYEKSCLLFNVVEPLENVLTRPNHKMLIPGVVRPLLSWDMSEQ